MGKLWSFLSGPVGSLVDSVGSVIDNLHTSGEEKLAAKMKLLELEQSFQRQLLEADVEWAKTQAEVLKTEIASTHWMAANWRPILMLTFTYVVAHNFVIAPIFSLDVLPLPPDMWDLLKIGVGGYIVGRSAEKIIPNSKWAGDSK